MSRASNPVDPAVWDELRAAAFEVATRAYAPYSRFRVGAAARLRDGRVVTGCNVENASYPVGVCAEAGLISALHRDGFAAPTELAVWSPESPDEPLTPCGSCRQVLHEAGGSDLQIVTGDGVVTIEDLLPNAFVASDLPDSG